MDCPDYASVTRENSRCFHYLGNGACGHRSRAQPGELPGDLTSSECTVWRAKNPQGTATLGPLPPLAPAAILLTPPAKAASGAQEPPGRVLTLGLVPQPPPQGSTAAQKARTAFTRPAAVPEAPVLAGSALEAREARFERQVAELEAIGPEVHLATDAGPVVLVRAPTGQARREITFRAMALLVAATEAFPGAKIVGWHDAPPPANPERPA